MNSNNNFSSKGIEKIPNVHYGLINDSDSENYFPPLEYNSKSPEETIKEGDIFDLLYSFPSTGFDTNINYVNEKKINQFDNYNKKNNTSFNYIEKNTNDNNGNVHILEEKNGNNKAQKINPEDNQKEKENITKKFIIKKTLLGRKRKEDKNSKRKRTEKDNDNASKKFINKCIESINNCINDKISLNKDKIGLYKPNLKKYLPSKAKDKKEFFQKEIRNLYEFATIKRCKKENKNNYIKHNKSLMEKLKDEKINKMLNTSFKDYFIAFLNDEKIINEEIILNQHFKTLNECFNNIEGKDGYYTEEEKNRIKEYCIKLVNGGIASRNRIKK